MEKELALQIILYISIAGLLFSGYLSFKELYAKSCGIKGCGQSLFKVPVCIYGFFMYLLILIITILSLI